MAWGMPQSAPPPSPRQLPIWQQQAAIVDAIAKHRVVIIDGPPGCGKTTQLPQMLADHGLVPRLMGITQPRRIAAIGVARRIAFEMGVTLGQEVGYAIRFDDCTSQNTRIKVMTDGILLQETRSNPELGHYDIILVDEAHERSLNIDFTLGLLHRMLAVRRDLKIVISSATLPPGQFQQFFADVAGHVPVVRVHSRVFPLTMQYAPLTAGTAPDALADAVQEQVNNLLGQTREGHILAFLPGEGAIVKTQQHLEAQKVAGVRVVPLFGRLPQKEQEMVFDEAAGQRKVVLSTNIAETSITIDGVCAVVDCGLHKLPWYNARTGVTTLREEPISLASADQRAGRAGRTGPGTVVRLYTEESLAERPAFTREEILRIDLSEAVLRLIDLGITDVEHFALPTPPPRGKLIAALQHLMALGAIDKNRKLTLVGRRMVPYPLSPALARMVVLAAEKYPDALNDVLIVGALLSVRSPFTYPAGQELAAQRAQERLRHPMGDAMTTLGAYHRWQLAPDKAAFCQQSFLDADTMQFVSRAHDQLVDIAEKLGNVVGSKRGEPADILRCLATGFVDKLLARRGSAFETTQGVRVAIHPSSAMFSNRKEFAVAAELMSSGRTYAFGVSALEPAWVAEVSEEAARLWRIKSARKAAPARSSGTAAPSAEAATAEPLQLRIGTRLYAIKGGRRGKHKLEFSLAQARALAATHRPQVDATHVAMRTSVVSPHGVVLRGGLKEVLACLPHVPWPKNDTGDDARLPPSMMVDVDRSLHALGAHLPRLASLVAGPHCPQAGWVTLVDNGDGGVWFDVVGDFVESILLSLRALTHITEAQAIAAEPALITQLKAAQRQLQQTLHAIGSDKHGQLLVQRVEASI